MTRDIAGRSLNPEQVLLRAKPEILPVTTPEVVHRKGVMSSVKRAQPARPRGRNRVNQESTGTASSKLAMSWEARINLGELSQILHWSRRLGCSEPQLRDAVRAVGMNAADVRRYLGR